MLRAWKKFISYAVRNISRVNSTTKENKNNKW